MLTYQLASISPAGLLRRLTRFAQPSPAPSSRYKDAEAVRELAASYANTDPSFASELYAAADRHERDGQSQ